MKALSYLFIALTLVSFLVAFNAGHKSQPRDAEVMNHGLSALGYSIASGAFAIASAIAARGSPDDRKVSGS